MAKKILTDINLNKLEAQNVTIQNLASDPSSPVKGQVYFNTTTNKFRCYNGSTWDEMGTGGGTVTSVAVSNDTNGGLSVSGSPVTSSGTITVGHSNVLANAQTTSGIYPIKIDKNGHISEYGSAVDLTTYAPLSSPALTGTPTAPTPSSGDNTTKIATTEFVTTAISGVSGAMVFKGTVTTSNTLPTTGVKIGDTYKVAEAGTYDVGLGNTQVAKVGDLFIATATRNTPQWAYVPSGDDTGVTSVTAGVGLNTTSNDTATDGGSITSTGTLYLTKSGVTAGTYNNVTVDKYGRVTSGSNVTGLTKYSASIVGDGTTTLFSFEHNITDYEVIVQVYDANTGEDVIVDVARDDENTVSILFATAPDLNDEYIVIIIG